MQDRDESATLREEVESFPRWHYEFDLKGVRTPIIWPKHVNRHEQRKEYFFSPLVDLYGGSLEGRRVLDLACNAGFWSLAAADAGAAFVLGVDGRQMHIDQANLVFRAKGVDPRRFEFRTADVFDLDPGVEAPFDIVLCLGLLYHVSKPVELMERIASWNSDLLVIDTDIATGSRPLFRLLFEDVDDPRSALGRGVALRPSTKAVLLLARHVGYQSVEALTPQFTNWEAAGDYKNGRRRAFICSKRPDAFGEALGKEVGAVKPSLRRRLQRAARGSTTRAALLA